MSVTHLYAQKTDGAFGPVAISTLNNLGVNLAESTGILSVQSNNADLATQSTLSTIADGVSIDGGAVSTASMAVGGSDGTNHQTMYMSTDGAVVVAGVDGANVRNLVLDASGHVQADILSTPAATTTAAWAAATATAGDSSTAHVAGPGEKTFSAFVAVDEATDITVEVSPNGTDWFPEGTTYAFGFSESRFLNLGTFAAVQVRLKTSAAQTIITATIVGVA